MKVVLLIALACLVQLSQAFVVPAGAARFSCSSSSIGSNVRRGAGSTTARPAAPKKTQVMKATKTRVVKATKAKVMDAVTNEVGTRKKQRGSPCLLLLSNATTFDFDVALEGVGEDSSKQVSKIHFF